MVVPWSAQIINCYDHIWMSNLIIWRGITIGIYEIYSEWLRFYQVPYLFILCIPDIFFKKRQWKYEVITTYRWPAVTDLGKAFLGYGILQNVTWLLIPYTNKKHVLLFILYISYLFINNCFWLSFRNGFVHLLKPMFEIS